MDSIDREQLRWPAVCELLSALFRARHGLSACEQLLFHHDDECRGVLCEDDLQPVGDGGDEDAWTRLPRDVEVSNAGKANVA